MTQDQLKLPNKVVFLDNVEIWKKGRSMKYYPFSNMYKQFPEAIHGLSVTRILEGIKTGEIKIKL